MGEWKRVKLEEVADYVTDKSEVMGLALEDYISTENMLPNKGGISLASSVPSYGSVTEFCQGDVLVSNIRPYFKKIWKATRDGFCSNDILALRVKNCICDNFLFSALSNDAFFDYVMASAKGTKMPRGDKQQILEYPILLPPLPTQRKIAAVLGALDDKIENNRKICANLEAQAQAIFKSWFVDFEPFGGKQITDVIWGNHPEELRYVKVGNLNPILETGSRPKGGAALSGIPSIGAENVKQLGEFDFGAKKFIPEEYAAKLKRGKINGYELLLYKDGGKPGMFKPHFSMFGEGFPYEECYINEHVFKVDFGNRATNIFAYFYFKSQYVFNWLEMNGGKAAIPGINQSNVLDVMMPDPTHKLVQEFGESVEPLFKMIFNLCKESRSLAALRDALLPKLMSGEIDVEKVEVA
ncbi:MAG: restriction endonuclease subunit S [Kiritimatiellae bacterium]|nr:restriction endonuclease subunit S [Kiritimatiellia bacterium]